MSGSNCHFLTCIPVSQEIGKVVSYSHLFKNFPQFVVIHTVKGFSVVTDAEVDVFPKFPCFLYDPTNVGNLIPDLVNYINIRVQFGNSTVSVKKFKGRPFKSKMIQYNGRLY